MDIMTVLLACFSLLCSGISLLRTNRAIKVLKQLEKDLKGVK